MIEQLSKQIPEHLQHLSGKVFYSGRNAFEQKAGIYVLGLNPGGDPSLHTEETVGAHTDWVLTKFDPDWSAYRDESWKGKAPGKSGMQPRVLHLFSRLGFSAGEVPASNLVFVRSSRESTFEGDLAEVAEDCWPFHLAVIEKLKPTVVVCLGLTAGKFVGEKLGATKVIEAFVEQNKRRWTSRLFDTKRGTKVAVLTHPSRVNWRAAATDPTNLVANALGGAA
ncbi:MAG: uracil-DNA glycosylase family protein [Proteobacteria bacterium]|nr:uracil-DNA glycosylase family protein [Pseudomonadota bacterium]